MKYIKVFEDHSDYTTYRNGANFVTPNVSVCVEEEDVHYNPYVPLHDYSQDYLTFEALESGTFTLSLPQYVNENMIATISYSMDNGETWVTTNNTTSTVTITTPLVTAGDKVLWKGSGKQFSPSKDNYNSSFSSTCNFKMYGNMMSLLYGDDFTNQVTFPSESQHNFACLFRNNVKLNDVCNLILPATTLMNSCYANIFNGCTNLTTVPVLSATALAQECYSYMFCNCGNITTVPSLSATTLVNGCYQGMFYGCTSLTSTPTLSATTLANNCYNGMFNGCTSLTTAPELPATTLAAGCYTNMFRNCSNLTHIKAMFTTTPTTTYTDNWVNGVASTGTFIKNSAANWDVTGTNGVPSGWTVQTASE